MARRSNNKPVTVSINWLECFILEPIKFDIRRPRKILINSSKPKQYDYKSKSYQTVIPE